jgi:hypothetical protein
MAGVRPGRFRLAHPDQRGGSPPSRDHLQADDANVRRRRKAGFQSLTSIAQASLTDLVTKQPAFLPLSDADAGWLDAARTWVKGHFTDDAEAKYGSVAGKLRVTGAILANGWVLSTETWKLQALGAAFGDALSQELLLDWVTVDDQLGATAALNWPGTSVLSFPLTAISKRVEQAEQVDVGSLFDQACESLREMAFSGRAV